MGVTLAAHPRPGQAAPTFHGRHPAKYDPLPFAVVPAIETERQYLDGDRRLLASSRTVSQADVLVTRLHVDLRRQASAICANGH
ncbi:putative leader peptide [Streptomyces xiamenensis]|uniref:putative leader peptide n=2 Tax=Streptomyces TaxID=1883 RepID=UPI003673FC55